MMRIKDYLLPLLLVLALLAAGVWLMENTEWVDTQTPTPAKGEALKNPYYATQRLLRELGGTVVKRTSLDELPPPRGRLILESEDWDMFAGRSRQLRAWVEQGGHLIVPVWMVEAGSLKDWLPVVEKQAGDEDDEDTDEGENGRPLGKSSAPKAAPQPDRKREIKIEGVNCFRVIEPPAVPARYPGQRDYVVCGWRNWMRLVPAQGRGQPLWQVDNQYGGTEIIHVPFGRGTVTVLNNSLLTSQNVVRGDTALLAVSALQARCGAQFWFVTEESREGLLAWLWSRGSVAVALGLLALGLAVWRGAARFGPLAHPVSVNRRSMAEQVRGTGRFLRAHGGAALHAAQLRALHEAAAPRIRHYATLDTDARAAAIAAATGLDRVALALAMRAPPRNPATLAQGLELLETARRQLLTRAPGGAILSTPR